MLKMTNNGYEDAGLVHIDIYQSKQLVDLSCFAVLHHKKTLDYIDSLQFIFTNRALISL